MVVVRAPWPIGGRGVWSWGGYDGLDPTLPPPFDQRSYPTFETAKLKTGDGELNQSLDGPFIRLQADESGRRAVGNFYMVCDAADNLRNDGLVTPRYK